MLKHQSNDRIVLDYLLNVPQRGKSIKLPPTPSQALRHCRLGGVFQLRFTSSVGIDNDALSQLSLTLHVFQNYDLPVDLVHGSSDTGITPINTTTQAKVCTFPSKQYTAQKVKPKPKPTPLYHKPCPQ